MLRDPLTYQTIGIEAALKKFGVPPHQVVDVQALAGDSSDNVPGVPGIGVKTAAELITQFGNLENLLASVDQIKQPKRKQLLTDFAEQARISKQLVILKDDVPLSHALAELNRQPVDMAALAAFLTENGFKSVLQRLGLQNTATGRHPDESRNPVTKSAQSAQNNILHHAARDKSLSLDSGVRRNDAERLSQLPQKYWLVKTADELRAYIQQSHETGMFALDVETDGLVPSAAPLIGIALSVRAGEGIYVPITLPNSRTNALTLPLWEGRNAERFGEGEQMTLFTPSPKSADADFDPPTGGGLEAQQDGLPLADAVLVLNEYLSAPHILKVAHNLKFDWQVMQAHGFADPMPYDDTMLLSYVVTGGGQGHGLKELAKQHFNITMTQFSDLVATNAAGKKAGKATHFGQVPLDAACQYAAADTDITLRLYQLLKPQLLAQQQVQLYEQFERPLVAVVTAMEAAGIRIDPAKLKKLSDDFAAQLQVLESEIYGLAGQIFNIGSPKQLGEILFGKLQIPSGKKSGKSGEWSTAAGELEPLAAQYPIVEKVLNWRQLAKLKNTYADTLPLQIQPRTGRIHTSYALAATNTGRLSSNDPNLQNIPVRTREGQAIRAAFVAAPGHMLIAADYSQIELRLAAQMADIPALKQAFADGVDIHQLTASEVLGVPFAEVSKEQRRAAKAINFGIIYGISSWGLARQLGVPGGEAGDYIKRYFSRFPELRDYMENAKVEAREFGYVKTLFGRRCMIPGATDKNAARRAGAERQAINAPLQGTAADIMKMAMVDVNRALAGTETRILLQVHDELICEAPVARANIDAKLIQQTMMQVGVKLGLSIPLLVDVDVKEYWE